MSRACQRRTDRGVTSRHLSPHSSGPRGQAIGRSDRRAGRSAVSPRLACSLRTSCGTGALANPNQQVRTGGILSALTGCGISWLNDFASTLNSWDTFAGNWSVLQSETCAYFVRSRALPPTGVQYGRLTVTNTDTNDARAGAAAADRPRPVRHRPGRRDHSQRQHRGEGRRHPRRGRGADVRAPVPPRAGRWPGPGPAPAERRVDRTYGPADCVRAHPVAPRALGGRVLRPRRAGGDAVRHPRACRPAPRYSRSPLRRRGVRAAGRRRSVGGGDPPPRRPGRRPLSAQPLSARLRPSASRWTSSHGCTTRCPSGAPGRRRCSTR